MDLTNALDNFINTQWLSLSKYSPQVPEIINKLNAEFNTKLIPDHIAYRTFNTGPLRLEALHRFVLDAGYYETGVYQFHDKHVVAKSYSHLLSNHPKLFLSEVQVEKLSEPVQNIIGKRILSIKPLHDRTWLNTFGNVWFSNKITDEDVTLVDKESEYASWVLLHGLKPNHYAFDVSDRFMGDVISLLENKFKYKVKGSPTQLLEQVSVMSEHRLYPGMTDLYSAGYVEFVKRYPDPHNGNKLFNGFLEKSADKIFESTFKK